MSGIAGIIRFDGAPVESQQIKTMTASMAYRGPDGISHWVRGSVALGQCMLRTTPESLEETQPLTNEDESLVLVMDGRVDNWEELRRELLSRGAKLRTRSDAELVLRAYEVWGRDCLQHIDGDFAFVIWDARRQEAFCARDRTGIKPFNYNWDGKTLIFASELHAILAMPWVRQELNEGVVAEYVASEWYSRDETFWKGIARLVAGHQMEVGIDDLRLSRYWQPDCCTALAYKTDDEYAEHYRELLFKVVRRMSRSQRVVAYEVSGGLDSSALFCVAEQIRRQGKLPAPAIEGYSFDFRSDPDANELEYSRAVGQHLGIRIHEMPPTDKPLSWYREWARHYREFPGYPNGAMAIGLREAAGQRGSRTLLAGTGGDEWLGLPWTGSYYAEELALGHWKNVYNCLRADSKELGIGKTAWWLCRYGTAPLLPVPIKKYIQSIFGLTNERPVWLSSNLQTKIDSRRAKYCEPVPPSLGRRGQAMQMRVLTDPYNAVARELEERLCSRLGLELRSPFFNQSIIQFAFSTPERLRQRGHTTKWLHRRALRGVLPDVVRRRTSKAEFITVFRRQLDQIDAEFKNNIVCRRTGWIVPQRAVNMYDSYKEPSLAGWAEWLLWGLVGCDSLADYEN